MMMMMCVESDDGDMVAVVGAVAGHAGMLDKMVDARLLAGAKVLLLWEAGLAKRDSCCRHPLSII